MQTQKLRAGLVRAASIGAAAAASALILGLGAGVASAAPGDPSGGATPVAPHFYNGNVEGIRGSGSDTTFFMMQKIGDLFTGAGLYGCALNASAGGAMFNTNDTSTSSNLESFCVSGGNVPTTDVNDNWDRTEVTEGVDDVGSGAGQGQLCGTTDIPAGLSVDFARSSKPAGSSCGTTGQMVQTGYAKDSVPLVDYPINPSVYGTSAFSAYSGINGGSIGDVALGWLPGDPVTCTNTSSCSGTQLSSVSNADGGPSNSTGGADSTAYRIWCSSDNTATDAGARITDWGQLTNLGPNLWVDGVTATSGQDTITASTTFPSTGLFPSTIAAGDTVTGTDFPAGTTVLSVSSPTANTLTLSNPATNSGTVNVQINTGSSTLLVGQGLPVAVPIRVMGVNTASGTESTFAAFADGTDLSGGCSSSMNTNDQFDPNSATLTGDNTSKHIALENNSDQLDQFAAADFPSPDYVDQAIEVATTLYIESNGVFNTNPYAAASTIDGTPYSGNKVELNGVLDSTANELANKFPTARTLFNIYNATTVRASVGGFLNWICDGNSSFSKGIDNTSGINFDTELTTLISTTYGFPRLTDTSVEPAILTPADGIGNPNNSCAASLPVTVTSGANTITLTAGGNFPPDIVNAGGLVGGGSVGITNADFPAGTTVVSGVGTSTLTLSNSATAGGTSVATVFSGVPSVTTVANTQS